MARESMAEWSRSTMLICLLRRKMLMSEMERAMKMSSHPGEP